MILTEAINAERLFGMATLPDRITDPEMKVKALEYHGADINIDLDKVDLQRKYGMIYILRWDPSQKKGPAKQIIGTRLTGKEKQGINIDKIVAEVRNELAKPNPNLMIHIPQVTEEEIKELKAKPKYKRPSRSKAAIAERSEIKSNAP